MTQFATFQTTQYVLGNGSIRKIEEWKDKKIGFVIDENILKGLKLDVLLFDEILKDSDYKILCNIRSEPTMAALEEPIRAVKEYSPDYIIGIGGGSVMDTAKALWLFYELPHYTWEEATKPYEVEPFPGKATLVVVPTTSGTGSETTGCCVVKDDEKRKCMILSNEIIPSMAIMDYDLLKSLPGKNIAYSGTDALAHAIEAGSSSLASAMVKMQCVQAAVTVIKQLPASYRGDSHAREAIHIAAAMAGAGINNSITGMAHGMDQMGGDFEKPHGLITGMLLPYTMRYLAPQPIYEEVADQLGYTGTSEEKQNALIQRIWDVYKEIDMPTTLEAIDISREDYMKKIPSYIQRAINDSNILFAPKDPTEAELEKLYKDFYDGLENQEA